MNETFFEKNFTIKDYKFIANRLTNCSELTAYGKYYLNISNGLLFVYPWILIVFGTIGNTLSLIILTCKKLRKYSTFVYLACLTVVDLIVLYTFCINFISFYFFRVDLQSKHDVLCKLFAFCIYFLPQLSAWTCAMVSLDRVVSVIFSVGNYAVVARQWNTPSCAWKVMIAVGK